MAAIRAHELAKQYALGERERYLTLRDQLSNLFRARRPGARAPRRTMWALDGVSFEVAEGQAIGLIGPNGAGKTTLLRILSRITEPTRGYAEIRGRVGSLLEVGTGFHPELTGRENVLLNGAVLGMRRREIEAKFDEIVDFAGVEQFIDTPVKRYSTGMQVRLAFAVAAHLEPEILVVDEVLAVGDAEFQRKCLGKMETVGRSGRTVVFVSHNMTAVTRLCERVLLLRSGRLVEDGEPEAVVAEYLRAVHGSSATREWSLEAAPGNDLVRLRSVKMIGEAADVAAAVDVRSPIDIELELDVLAVGEPFVPWLALYTDAGAHAFSAMDVDPAWRAPRDPGRYHVRATIPPNLLNEGTIVVTVALNTFASGRAIRQAFVEAAVSFQVTESGDGVTARGHYAGTWPGPVRPLLAWSTRYEPALAPVSS